FGLAEGGYEKSIFSDLLPVSLPNKQQTFFREVSTVELTPAGRDSLITRLQEDPAKNAALWPKLPYLARFQEVGMPKPGATVLATVTSGPHGKLPLLVTQNYGAGRTALLATSGTWRWQMLLPYGDKTAETFWQQLLRWLVTDTHGQMEASAEAGAAD